MNVMHQAANPEGQQQAIGWDGKTLQEMIAESERHLADSGRYYGIDALTIKEGDPIRYEKIWSRLRGGLVGARETALNISASPIVREIGELCFGLYTPEGDSITLSTGIMAHIHTMSEAIKHMIRSDYETNPCINPGDIFVNNDPQTGDVHNADVQEILPIYWEGELIAWAAGVTHEIDVGAPQPCGMPIGTVNRYEDGWILRCQKVGRNDRLDKDYENRIESAVRTPFYWLLDEKCRISGCHLIRDTVLRLIQDEGIDTYKTFIREVIEDTRRSFIQRIRESLVPGVYRSPAFMDVPHGEDKGAMPTYAAIDSLMHCPLKLTVDENASFDLDLEGANKWGHHSLNCTPSGIQGGLWVAICQTLISNEKFNDGSYLATTFNTPFGSWANPDNMNASNVFAWAFLIPCFTGLIHSLSRGFASRGYLEEVLAAYPFTGNITQGGGMNHYGQDSAWSNFEMSCCGISARWAWDGEAACAAVWNPEGDMGDVEAWEILEPALYLGRNIRPNTGGMGRTRGGSGFESIRMIYGTADQVMYHSRDGHVFPTSGLYGGYPGASGYRHSIKNTDMAKRFTEQQPYPVRDVDPENSQMSANVAGDHVRDRRCFHYPDPHSEYDVYLSMLAGGHGVGDVLERHPDAVAEDINSGQLSARYAEPICGVIGSEDADGIWAADHDATRERRARCRKERLARSIPVEDWIDSQRDRVRAMEFLPAVRNMYRDSADLSPSWNDDYKAFWGLDGDWTP